jgi:hypothetical protein
LITDENRRGLMKNDYIIDGDYVYIKLKRKSGEVLETKVDFKNFKKINQYNTTWFARYDTKLKQYYVYTHYDIDKKRYYVHMHRLITNCPEIYEVDHINHDTLDNTEKNLKVCDRPVNMLNRKLCKNSTKSRGVFFRKDTGKYRVIIGMRGKIKRFGSYETKEEAKIVAENEYEKIKEL